MDLYLLPQKYQIGDTDGCVKVRATKPSGFDLHRAGLSGKKHLKKLLIIQVFVKYLEVYR